MKRQFVVVVNDESALVVNATVERLNKFPGVKWSHYMKGLWQIVDTSGALTAAKLRVGIREALPDTMVIAFEITGESKWSGWVPVKMADWIANNWE